MVLYEEYSEWHTWIWQSYIVAIQLALERQ